MFDSLRRALSRVGTWLKSLVGIVQMLVVLVLLVVATLIACRPGEEPNANSGFPQALREGMQAPRVTVAVVQPSVVSGTIEVDATGTMVYRTAVSIVPQVSGRVEWVSPNLREGGSFSRDEVLFKLDPIDTQLGVQQAKADLAAALADMSVANAQKDAAIENYRILNPGAEVPPLVAQEPQIERGQAAIDRAKARLLSAELALKRTEFSLPFAGKVLNSNVGVGQLLSVNQAVGQVYDLKELEAAIAVSNRDLSALAPVEGRGLLLDSNHGIVEARVERLSAELDERTRSATLFAKVTTTGHQLVPGDFVRARIFGQAVERAFILPEDTEQANRTVWIVRDGVIRQQPLVIHDRRDDGLLVEVFEYHDGIVRGTMPNLEEGDTVQLVGSRSS